MAQETTRRACTPLYVDKPMRGHGLMQAVARANRVFKDKPGSLVVDYLGLAHELKRALATYTESGGTGRNLLDQKQAVAMIMEKYEIRRGLFHGFDYARWIGGAPAQRIGLLPAAQEHILTQENGKDRCLLAVRELSQAFALAVPHEEAIRIRDDMAFFQAVRSVLAKRAEGELTTRRGKNVVQARSFAEKPRCDRRGSKCARALSRWAGRVNEAYAVGLQACGHGSIRNGNFRNLKENEGIYSG